MPTVTASIAPADIRTLSAEIGYDAHEYVYDALMRQGMRAEADAFASAHEGDDFGCVACRSI